MAEPRCKQQARFTEAAERAARPRRGGESSGLPALPRHRTKPDSTQPAWPRTPGCDAGLLLCATRLTLTPHNTYRSQTTSPGWGEAQLPYSTRDPCCPKIWVPQAPKGALHGAHSSICQIASFPRAGRGGPAPGKPPAAPLQDWEGSDICAPCLDEVYECLQRCPSPGGCGRASAHPRQGPIRDTAVVSGDRGMRPAALSTGYSRPGSPLRLVPPLTFLWGAAHACQPPRSAEPVPEGMGCRVHPLDGPRHPGCRRQRRAALQAREPGRHGTTCCPHAAGRARGTGSFSPRFGGTSPGPPVPPVPSQPPEPSVAVTCRGARHPQLRCQRASRCSTHRSDAWHLPQRCPAPCPALPALPALPGKQGAHHPGVPALPSPGAGAKPYSRWLQAGCRQAAGRCTVFRALAGLRGSSSRACLLKGNTRLSQPPARRPELG